MEPIRISMLGEFSIETETVSISDENKRTRKMWGLLAYLICSRKTRISQKKLLELLYGDDPDSVNPENALRIMTHRLRTLLDQLWSGAGKELILHKNGSYCWNPDAPIFLDCEEFDILCTNPGKEEMLPRYLEAIALYKGEFLPRHSDEGWVIPIAAHYHNAFLEISQTAARLLMERDRNQEAVQVCRRAVEVEPYHEPLYQLLMKALANLGDAKGAANVYENLKKKLFDDFGITPNEETRAIYRAAAHTPGDRNLPMDEVLDNLREPDSKSGALMCDYDYFKVLCYTQTRTMERSGHAAHVALINVVSTGDTLMAKQTMDRILEQLGEHIRLNLRRGDTASRCSATQYILLLPKANYENSCMVCRRVISSFTRTHPRAAVKLQFLVQPLMPGISVP